MSRRPTFAQACAFLLLLPFGANSQNYSIKPDPALEALASRIANALREAPPQDEVSTILVWPCSEPIGLPSQFGNLFAKEFTAVLLPALGSVPQLAGRVRITNSLVESVPATYALRGESVALDNAVSKNYDSLVAGTCELKEQEIKVELSVWDVSSRKRLGEAKGKLGRTPERRTAFGQLLRISRGKQPSVTEPLPRPGRDGITFPQCISCPNPAYDTRSMGKSGSVVVRVIVTADGEADNIILLRSVDPRLDEAAINGILRWKFKPATREGMPVAVWTTIEVNFHYR